METHGRYAKAELSSSSSSSSSQYSADYDGRRGRLLLVGPVSERSYLSLEVAQNLHDFLTFVLPQEPQPAASSHDAQDGGERERSSGITITHYCAITDEEVNALAQSSPQVVKLLNWPFRIVEFAPGIFIVQKELGFEDWVSTASDGQHTDVSTSLGAAQRQIEQIEQQTSNKE
jgi:hypothetical protein